MEIGACGCSGRLSQATVQPVSACASRGPTCWSQLSGLFSCGDDGELSPEHVQMPGPLAGLRPRGRGSYSTAAVLLCHQGMGESEPLEVPHMGVFDIDIIYRGTFCGVLIKRRSCYLGLYSRGP